MKTNYHSNIKTKQYSEDKELTELSSIHQMETPLRDLQFLESPKPPSHFKKIFSFQYHDKYNLIDPDFLVKLMKDPTKQLFIFDCRYAYEYKGGHIHKAIFCPSENGLKEFFFSENRIEKAIIVFHCEYSSKRAPAMIDKFRNLDRERNKCRYPQLWYPDVYLLNGGYKLFYETFPEYCSGYVPMEQNKRNQNSQKNYQNQNSNYCVQNYSNVSNNHSYLCPSAKNMKY